MTSISIVIPTYDSAWSIERCIESVFQQDCSDVIEIIVIDDNSKDDTVNILMAMDYNIRLIKMNKNVGPGEARNKGIQAAFGEFIAFIDSDDIMLTNRLNEQASFLDANPDVALVFGGILFDNNPREIYMSAIQPSSEWRIMSDPYRHLWVSGAECIMPSTVMTRKRLLEQVGGFSSKFRCGEDFDLWLKLAQLGPFAYKSGPYAIMNATRLTNKLTKSKFVYLDGPMAVFHALLRDTMLLPHDRAIARTNCRKSIEMMLRYEWAEGFSKFNRTPLKHFRREFGYLFVTKWFLVRCIPSSIARFLRDIRNVRSAI